MQQKNTSPERAIENLMVSYAYANDDADIEELGRLYKDATFRIDEMIAVGSDAIEAVASNMIQLMDDGRSSTTHELTNIVIDIHPSGDSATGRAYWTLYKTISGSPREAVLSGRYADIFVYHEGNWRFKERNATILWKLDS